MDHNQSIGLEVDRFYRLQSGKSLLTAFCPAPGKFVVKAGSVIDLDLWPNSLEPGYVDPDWNNADVDLALSGCAERLDKNMMLTFIKDYDGGTPLRMAQLATGRDDKDLDKLWTEATP